MGLFSRKTKPKPQVKNAISASGDSIFGSSISEAGTVVNERTFMQTATVFACIRVISEHIASLPIHIFEQEESGVKLRPQHHLHELLQYEPNPEMTSNTFRQTLMSHLLIHGNAYAQILRNGAGKPTALYPLMPQKIRVWRGDDGEIYYTYFPDYDDRKININSSSGITLHRNNVLHFLGLSPDALVGYSPLTMARQMVGSMIATEEFSASHFKNSACPSGVLEHTQTISDHDNFRLDWDKLHKGTKNTGKIAILEKGLTFKKMSLTPEESQFLGTRKFLRDEIAGWFNVPPHMIGDLEHATFSNIEHQSLAFVKNCLTPWIVKLEQTMRQKLLMPSEKGKYFIKFNLDGLLRGDYETRMKGYTLGIQNGFMCPNDIRRLENMNEIPDELGGNKFLVNGNVTELKNAGIAYKNNEEADTQNE